MKSVEDISESLNSLSQVISMSFTFAKSSPMKAKKSLTSCASYLQSKTFKSTSFLIRFFLVLIDLLKNEHVEILVLTILSMIKQLISLLKSKEVQIIITQSLKLTASQPVTNLINCITKCVQSLFYIIKTDEINKFQKQIWELIEDETKGKNTEIEKDTQIINECDENIVNNNNNEFDEENKNKNELNDSYYSPVRAWYGLTSMFSGYNDESDKSEDENKYENEISIRHQQNNCKQKMRSKSVSVIESHDAMSYNKIGCNNNKKNDMKEQWFDEENGNRKYEKRIDRETNSKSDSGSVGINDWVYLIHFIDELEDNGDISINEGDKLRKLAMDQKMTLLIVYKCYQNKPKRFIRYAKDILKDDIQLKQLKKMKKKSILNETDHIHINEQNINEFDENDGNDDDILCID